MDRGEAFGIFGAGTGVARRPRVASTAPSFPDGAVIRTLRKNYQPGGGAMPFHEHTWGAGLSTPIQAACSRGTGCKSPAEHPASTGQVCYRLPELCFVRIDLLTEELAIAKRDVTCIVDAVIPKWAMPIVAGDGFCTQPSYISTMGEEQVFSGSHRAGRGLHHEG
jgi:hypothetical protein